MSKIISIEIDNRDVNRVFDAISNNFKRPDKIDNPGFDHGRPENPGNPKEVDNPESQEDFVNRMIREFISAHVNAFEVKEARRNAADALDTSVRINKRS